MLVLTGVAEGLKQLEEVMEFTIEAWDCAQ